MEKYYSSLAEVQEHFSPNSLMNDLENELCKTYGLVYSHQHNHSKDNNNPKIGSIKIAIPDVLHSSPKEIIHNFYSARNYEVKDKEGAMMEIQKQRESYWVNVSEGSTSYTITIVENILSKISL